MIEPTLPVAAAASSIAASQEEVPMAADMKLLARAPVRFADTILIQVSEPRHLRSAKPPGVVYATLLQMIPVFFDAPPIGGGGTRSAISTLDSGDSATEFTVGG